MQEEPYTENIAYLHSILERGYKELSMSLLLGKFRK